MTEGLFILTTIFVAYVVYVVVNEQKATAKFIAPETKPEARVIVVEPQTHEAATKNEQPETISETTPTVTTQNPGKAGLRDPKTGEITTSYANYRFTKRWVKEALVAEGLLEKIYKNNELTPAIEASIKEALATLQAMDKYRA